eukprot:15474729-Alexandrium_andersonii.AAC.1
MGVTCEWCGVAWRGLTPNNKRLERISPWPPGPLAAQLLSCSASWVSTVATTLARSLAPSVGRDSTALRCFDFR